MFSAQFSANDFDKLVLGGTIGALIAISILIALIFFLALYVYISLTWATIAKKLKYKKSWLAWIPIANLSMILQLGGFHWAWVFLIFVPILGWIPLGILLVLSHWHIFEKRKFPGWFSLSLILPKIGPILYLIAIGFVAWTKKK